MSLISILQNNENFKIIGEVQTFAAMRKGVSANPVKHRRNVFIKAINHQIDLLDGKTDEGRAWWNKDEDGEYGSNLRYGSSAIDLGEDSYFSVSSKEALKGKISVVNVNASRSKSVAMTTNSRVLPSSTTCGPTGSHIGATFP